MHRFSTILAFSTLLAVSAVPASAMPVFAPVHTDGAPAIKKVALGCGIGFTRGSRGRCIPTSFGFDNGRYSGRRPLFNRRCFIVRGYYGPRRVCR